MRHQVERRSLTMLDLKTENELLKYELEEATETCQTLIDENESLRQAIALLEKVLYENGIVIPIIL